MSSSWADDFEETAMAPPAPPQDDQMDGATTPMGGSGLQDGEHDVEVKLSDLQAQQFEGNPLHSAKTFEELGMYAFAASTSAT